MSGIGDYANDLRTALQIDHEGGDTLEMLLLRAQETLAGMVGSFAEVTNGSDHETLEQAYSELATVGLYLSSALGALHSARDRIMEEYLPTIAESSE